MDPAGNESLAHLARVYREVERTFDPVQAIIAAGLEHDERLREAMRLQGQEIGRLLDAMKERVEAMRERAGGD